MALPILNDTPKYEMTIPSTNQTLKFRPYLVREEKVLMIAMESEDTNEIMKYAESIGNKPYVLIGENEERKDWTICID